MPNATTEAQPDLSSASPTFQSQIGTRIELTRSNDDIDPLFPIDTNPPLHRLLQRRRTQPSMIRPRSNTTLPQDLGNPITRVLRPGVNDPAHRRPRRERIGRVEGRSATLKGEDKGGEVVEAGGIGFEGGGSVADL
jgi:hypothetical protein